jgi:hypothetical protein
MNNWDVLTTVDFQILYMIWAWISMQSVWSDRAAPQPQGYLKFTNELECLSYAECQLGCVN